MWTLVPEAWLGRSTSYGTDTGEYNSELNCTYEHYYFYEGIGIDRDATTQPLFDALRVRIVLQNEGLVFDAEDAGCGLEGPVSVIHVYDGSDVPIANILDITINDVLPNFSSRGEFVFRIGSEYATLGTVAQYTGEPIISEIYYWAEPTTFWTNKVRTTEESIA
jgi:hypothetical protein